MEVDQKDGQTGQDWETKILSSEKKMLSHQFLQAKRNLLNKIFESIT